MIFTFWIHIQLKLTKNPTGNRPVLFYNYRKGLLVNTYMIFFKYAVLVQTKIIYTCVQDHLRVRCDSTSVLKYTLYAFWRRTECVYVHKVHQINKNELFFLLWYIQRQIRVWNIALISFWIDIFKCFITSKN